MTAEIFNGLELAARLEADLLKKLETITGQLTIAAIAFTQDAGSRIYSEVKAEAAARLGIEYQIHEFLFTTPLEEVLAEITRLNTDEKVTGIIIQKPRRANYEAYLEPASPDFQSWWRTMVEALVPSKDVDGLTGRGPVTPATCAAVLKIMDLQQFSTSSKILIVGKSDLLGWPLHKKLLELGWSTDQVFLVGRQELATLKARPEKLTDFDLIISATGVPNLITGDEIATGVALIDIGEPQGDFEFESCRQKARFMTPVPGGVGPMTVICLMNNVFLLVKANLQPITESH